MSKLIFLLAQPFHQLGDQSSRAVYLKILQGLINQIYTCVLCRLWPHIMVELVRTVAELEIRIIFLGQDDDIVDSKCGNSY